MDDFLEKASIFCSIASFLISIVLWIRTSEIKKDLLTKSRLPQMVKSFNTELSNLFLELDSWKDSGAGGQAHLRLSNLHSLLLGVSQHLSRREKNRMLANLKPFIEKRGHLGNYRPISEMTKEESWAVSLELNALSTSLKNKVLDMRAPQ